MTTIVGIQGDGWAVIGADSRITSFDEHSMIIGQSTLPKEQSKIVEKDEYLIGAAGDVRAINILHHIFEPPSLRYATTQAKIDQHITKRVIPGLRQTFDEQGFSPPDKQERDHQAEQNSTIIIAIKGRIYVIETDYSWTQDHTGIYTIGTGAQYARGALHALIGNSTSRLTPKTAGTHIRKALTIAAAHDPYTGLPSHVFTQVGP